MATPKTGIDHYMYYNSASYASPTLALICSIEDVSLTLSLNLADFKSRCTLWDRKIASTFMPLEASVKLQRHAVKANFDRFRADFLSKRIREYFFLDGPSNYNGSEGIRGHMLISEFPIAEPLEDISTVDMKLVLGYWEESSAPVDPAWYVVSGASTTTTGA